MNKLDAYCLKKTNCTCQQFFIVMFTVTSYYLMYFCLVGMFVAFIVFAFKSIF